MRTVGTGRPPVVQLESSRTFRDLGGYPTADGGRTRHGLVYRSAALTDVTAADRATLSALGLRTVVDLRASFEVTATGATVFADLDAQRTHVPLLDATDPTGYVRMLSQHVGGPDGYRDLGAVYTAMLDLGGDSFAQAFSLVVGRLPALHLCSAGKDRSGLLSALLLRVARVPDPIVAVDYACSVPSGDSAPIEHALRHLDRRWGCAETYLAAHGARRSAIEAFRAAFVSHEPSSARQGARVIVLPDDSTELATG